MVSDSGEGNAADKTSALPWLANYPKGVAATLPEESNYQTLLDVYQLSIQAFSDRPAYANTLGGLTRTLSFAEVDVYSQQLAAYLQSQGLRRGDRIALLLPNLLHFPISLFAAIRCGLTIVNMNPLLPLSDMQRQLSQVPVDAAVVLEQSAANLAQAHRGAQNQRPLKTVVIARPGDILRAGHRQAVDFAASRLSGPVMAYRFENSIRWRAAIEVGSQHNNYDVRCASDDTAIIQFTAGTTAAARPIALSHANLIANLQQVTAWIGPHVQPGQEIVIAALPMFHVFSLVANCLTFLQFGGLNVLVTNPRDLPAMAKQIGRYPFTTFTGINSLFIGLLSTTAFSELHFDNLKFTLGAGAAVPEAIAKHWQQVTGKPITMAYGLTEASPAVAMKALSSPDYDGSVGMPLPSTEATCIDADGAKLPLGQTGELWIRGPQVASYCANADRSHLTTPEGWLNTGDIGLIDKKGALWIKDRQQDAMLGSDGQPVYPNDIEGIVATHTGVLDCAAIQSQLGDDTRDIILVVVPRYQDLSEADLRAFCQAKLPKNAQPKRIQFREELPKTLIGKVIRRQLRSSS